MNDDFQKEVINMVDIPPLLQERQLFRLLVGFPEPQTHAEKEFAL